MDGPDTLPPTSWSAILAGRRPDTAGYDEAWGLLFRTYYPVIAAYFERRAPDRPTATDWTDEFVAHWVEGGFDRVDPALGRFRNYLRRSLHNFHLNKVRRKPPERLWGLFRREADAGGFEPAAPDGPPEEAFERDFARRVLELALGRLLAYERTQQEAGRANWSHALVTAFYLADPRPSQADLAVRFGLTRKAVERQLDAARERLRGWIEAEVRPIVADDSELAAELALLASRCPPLSS